MSDRLAKKIRLKKRSDQEGEDLLKRLGPYEKPFYPRLIRLCRRLVELHEEEGYQTLVDSWNEDQEVQSAYELYEIIDSMEED